MLMLSDCSVLTWLYSVHYSTVRYSLPRFLYLIYQNLQLFTFTHTYTGPE